MWILMDPYGPVSVCMVPGDLFQGFPGPNPPKNIEKYWFWGGGVGSPPDPHLFEGVCSTTVILAPGTWMVGSELQFTTSFPADPVDPLPCRKVVFRLSETLTFEIKALSLRP